MSKVWYKCTVCKNEIPELQLYRIEGFLHHVVGEKNPQPCGPVRKVETVIIKDPPPKMWSPCWFESDGVYCPSCGKGPKEKLDATTDAG